MEISYYDSVASIRISIPREEMSDAFDRDVSDDVVLLMMAEDLPEKDCRHVKSGYMHGQRWMPAVKFAEKEGLPEDWVESIVHVQSIKDELLRMARDSQLPSRDDLMQIAHDIARDFIDCEIEADWDDPGKLIDSAEVSTVNGKVASVSVDADDWLDSRTDRLNEEIDLRAYVPRLYADRSSDEAVADIISELTGKDCPEGSDPLDFACDAFADYVVELFKHDVAMEVDIDKALEEVVRDRVNDMIADAEMKEEISRYWYE